MHLMTKLNKGKGRKEKKTKGKERKSYVTICSSSLIFFPLKSKVPDHI